MAGRAPENEPSAGSAGGEASSSAVGHVRPLEALSVVLFPVLAIGAWIAVFVLKDPWYVSVLTALCMSSVAVQVVRKFGHAWRGTGIKPSPQNGEGR